MEFDVIVLMHHPKQRGVVLDGVGAEDRKLIHYPRFVITFSTALTKTSVFALELCLARGFKSGFQMACGLMKSATLSSMLRIRSWVEIAELYGT